MSLVSDVCLSQLRESLGIKDKPIVKYTPRPVIIPSPEPAHKVDCDCFKRMELKHENTRPENLTKAP